MLVVFTFFVEISKNTVGGSKKHEIKLMWPNVLTNLFSIAVLTISAVSGYCSHSMHSDLR